MVELAHLLDVEKFSRMQRLPHLSYGRFRLC